MSDDIAAVLRSIERLRATVDAAPQGDPVVESFAALVDLAVDALRYRVLRDLASRRHHEPGIGATVWADALDYAAHDADAIDALLDAEIRRRAAP